MQTRGHITVEEKLGNHDNNKADIHTGFCDFFVLWEIGNCDWESVQIEK